MIWFPANREPVTDKPHEPAKALIESLVGFSWIFAGTPDSGVVLRSQPPKLSRIFPNSSLVEINSASTRAASKPYWCMKSLPRPMKG